MNRLAELAWWRQRAWLSWRFSPGKGDRSPGGWPPLAKRSASERERLAGPQQLRGGRTGRADLGRTPEGILDQIAGQPPESLLPQSAPVGLGGLRVRMSNESPVESGTEKSLPWATAHGTRVYHRNWRPGTFLLTDLS